MKLLLDSANRHDIATLGPSLAICGVTTNPSLMAKEERGDYLENIRWIAELLDKSVGDPKHLSVELIKSPSEMFDEAQKIWKSVRDLDGVDLYVKVPLTVENLALITDLSTSNIQVNATCCMMYSQAKMAVDAGAEIVSFFYNRMKDGNIPLPLDEITKGADYARMHDAQVICGSIRKAEDVFECWRCGATYVTAGMGVIRQMMNHPETEKAIKQFQEDIEKWQG